MAIPGELLALVPIPFFFEDLHRDELVGRNILEGDPDAQLESGAQVESAPDQDSGFRLLCGFEPVQRAVLTPPAVLGRLRAESRFAQLIAPEPPIHEVPERGLLRPLAR